MKYVLDNVAFGSGIVYNDSQRLLVGIGAFRFHIQHL
jgi:hypothetical protein